ncbi:uncharacterized protein LOC111264336 [Varroa jacobsoni]|nr:uncharacterized protein LOC111264336 [Varroa jacobsoni]
MYGKLLDILANSLNFEYEVRNVGFWGLRLQNGSWTGAMGELQRDNADIALMCGLPTYEGSQVTVISPTLNPVDIAILAARKNRFLKIPFALVNGFDLEVWLLLLLTLVSVTIEMTLIHCGLVRSSNFIRLLYFYVTQLFGNIWAECSARPPSFNALRMIWISWMLGISMILMNAFAGNLKGLLLFKAETPRISGPLDVANQQKMKVFLPLNSFENLLMTSDKASVRSLYHRAVIEQHTATPPAELFSDKILNAVFEGQAVLLASRPAIGRGTMAQCKNLKRGEFYTARELIGTYHAVIFYNRRMPIHLQEAINERLMRLYDSGILDEWFRKVNGAWTGCSAVAGGSGDDRSMEALHLADLEGLFYIVLMGQTSGSIVFILEYQLHRLLCEDLSAQRPLE